MKKILAHLILVVAIVSSTLQVNAQEIKQVFIDNTKRMLNQGGALPAGSNFYLTGSIQEDVTMVKVEIYRNEKASSLVYSNTWKRHYSDNSPNFYLPVEYKLAPNSKYNVHLTYYKTIDGEELASLKEKIAYTLKAYIDAITTNTDQKIQLNGSVNENMLRLNKVMQQSFSYYESHRNIPFPGFSDLIRLKLEQLKSAGLGNAKFNLSADSTVQDNQLKEQYATQLTNELKTMLMNEANEYIHSGLRTELDDFIVKNYPTERTKSYLPVNIGYGAVYLGGNVKNLDYDAQPYVGISIPFGNPKVSRALANASFSLGIFLKNLEDKENREITGPIVDKPVYLGLGYKIFDFIKLNAGIVATSTDKVDLNNFKTENVKLQPFVGISAEFNISIGTNK